MDFNFVLASFVRICSTLHLTHMQVLSSILWYVLKWEAMDFDSPKRAQNHAYGFLPSLGGSMESLILKFVECNSINGYHMSEKEIS